MNRKKVLGISDSEDTCCCCGKVDLKRVVFIEDTETGEVAWFGTTCATKQMGCLFGEIKKMADDVADEARRERAAKLEELALTPEAKAVWARNKEWSAFRDQHAIKPGKRHAELFARFMRDVERAHDRKFTEIVGS